MKLFIFPSPAENAVFIDPIQAEIFHAISPLHKYRPLSDFLVDVWDHQQYHDATHYVVCASGEHYTLLAGIMLLGAKEVKPVTVVKDAQGINTRAVSTLSFDEAKEALNK